MKNTATYYLYKNIKIAYYEYGNGTPVLFLHGFGASSFSWRDINKSLPLHYKSITIDLKGFGLSDKPISDEYSADDQANIIYDFIINKNLDNVILVGHSFGGGVALKTYFRLAKNNKLNVKKLILIDSTGYKQEFPIFIKILRTPILNKLSFYMLPSSANVRFTLSRCFYDLNKITDNIVNTYSYYMGLPGAFHALIMTAKHIIPDDIDVFVAQYKNINIPVLLIWGKEDSVIPLSLGERFNSDIPGSKLVVIDKCGHVPHEEQPEKILPTITEFLAM